MKKVLFLMGRYLPQPSVNSICVDNVIDELLKHDVEITCVCYEDFQIGQKDNVRIIKVRRNIFDSILYKTEGKTGWVVAAQKCFSKFMLDVRDVCCLPCWPYNEPLYWRKVYNICDRLTSSEDIDTVVCVHMPLSSLMVGSKLKEKHPHIQYIPYFLDSLSDGNRLRLFSDGWNFRHKFAWERKLLKNADTIIAMESSRKHHEKVSKRETYFKKIQYLDIPLLKRASSAGVNPFHDDKIHIVFTGTANFPLRNIPYILKILKRLEKENFTVYFIGNTNYGELKNNTLENVEYIPFVPHDALSNYLQNADCLLNMGVTSPSAISGKIFEYMAYGKPIISTYAIQNEACIPYLNRYPCALLLDENNEVELEAERFKQFVLQNKETSISVEKIEREYYGNTPASFVEQIEKAREQL